MTQTVGEPTALDVLDATASEVLPTALAKLPKPRLRSDEALSATGAGAARAKTW